MERFMIATFLSVGMLTYYSVPFDLVSKIAVFPASIAPALFPFFSYHGSSTGNIVSDVTSRALKYLLLVMTPGTVIFVFFGRNILQLWMGNEFAEHSTVVLQITAVAFFLNAFAFIPYTSVQALGRPDLKAILDLITLPLYAITSWWLMRRVGINGAAVAKLIVTIFDTGFLFLFAWRLKAFSVRDCVSGPLFRALSMSGCLLAIVFMIESLHFNIILSLVLVALCLVVFSAVFWLIATDHEERVAIEGFSRRFLLGR
jgi:O-antigen/teichoic acid export membrane protein